MTPPLQDDILAAWNERDERAAVSRGDHQIIHGTLALRTLIVDLALRDPVDDDLYDACAGLGRLMAQQNGSPSLASATIGHAREALGATPAPWLAGARAALCEGFSASLIEMARSAAMLGWEFPRCAVKVDHQTIAIAAGYPADERDVLEAWAARTAKAAALLGIRRAIVNGAAAPRDAMVDALAVVGIEVDESSL
jgi:hypothetical protein